MVCAILSIRIDGFEHAGDSRDLFCGVADEVTWGGGSLRVGADVVRWCGLSG